MIRLRRKTYAQRFSEAFGEGVERGMRDSPLGQYMTPIPKPSRLHRAWQWIANLVRLR